MRRRHHMRQFTPEEMEQLASNPFTLRVTTYTITHTLEFKNLFLSHYYENDESAKDIFRQLGYDPEILGDGRIYSFASRLIRQIEAGEPLTEGSARTASEKPKNINYNTMPAQQSVASMQRELTYLRQQVEFLKKITALDKDEKPRN